MEAGSATTTASSGWSTNSDIPRQRIESSMSEPPADHDASATRLAENGPELAPPTPGVTSRRRRDHHALRASAQKTGSRSPLGLGFSVTLGVLMALALALALALLSEVLFDIFAAMFIALSLNPMANTLIRRGMPKGRAIFVVALGFAIVSVAVLVFLLPAVLQQLVELVRGLPGSLAELSNQAWVQRVNSATNGGADAVIQQISHAVEQPSFWAFVAGGVLGLGAGLAGWVSSGIFMAVLTLYFLVTLKGMKRGFYSLVSASKRHSTIYLTEKIMDSIGRYIGGMVVLSVINAVFSFVLLTLTRVPYAGAISVVTFFITLIPLIGTVVTTVIMTFFALLSSPVAGLIVLLAMLVYMQVEAYVMTPKAMGKALYIPGATVLISATAGAVLMGFAGALIANPVAAAITLIIRHVVVPRRNAQ